MNILGLKATTIVKHLSSEQLMDEFKLINDRKSMLSRGERDAVINELKNRIKLGLIKESDDKNV